MRSILEKIVALRGGYYGCIYQEGEVVETTFPTVNEEGISIVTQAVEQMFTALQAIDKQHNEVYFSMGDKQLIAYFFEDEYLVVLYTENKINLPLIHMGVKSAFVKIKALSLKQPTQSAKITPPSVEAVSPPLVQEISPPVPEVPAPHIMSVEVQEVMDNLKELLVDYLGPAAVFVFDDGVDDWKDQGDASESRLLNLVAILSLELNEGDERNEFIDKAKGYL